MWEICLYHRKSHLFAGNQQNKFSFSSFVLLNSWPNSLEIYHLFKEDFLTNSFESEPPMYGIG